MKLLRRRVLAVPVAVALLGAAPSPPAAAFLDTWGKIQSYTTEIRVHETKAGQTQDRTYNYAYLKPHFAKLEITGGAGKGAGASWKGGDTVSGHQGGLLSGIHLNISIHDSRAVDLRGGTVPQGSFADMADAIRNAPSETTSEMNSGGTLVDAVSLPYSDANGATRRTILLSRTTHLPVRRITYAGEVIVEDEIFTNTNPNAGLKESDF